MFLMIIHLKQHKDLLLFSIASAIIQAFDRGGKMKRECKWCGDEFIQSRAGNLFCSKACRIRHGNVFHRAETADPDYWSVTTPYGTNELDGLVASWLRSAQFLGSTYCGV
jgi:hypothetical protein